MPRIIYFLIFIISLAFASCNNGPAKNDNSIPEEEKQLRELVSRYPDSLLLKENLIQYFRNNGNFGAAIAETNTALNKDSLNDRFLDIKATLYFENGDTISAIRAFEKAIGINPQPEYIISLGSLYAQTKNPMALVMADALLQAPRANAQKPALFIKGLYYNYSGDKMSAISFFDSCLALDYSFMDAYREKAIALYDTHKYEDAVLLLEKAITVKKIFDEGYYWMGRCYEKLDKRKEAIDSYQIALRIDPDYVEAKDALARMGVR